MSSEEIAELVALSSCVRQVRALTEDCVIAHFVVIGSAQKRHRLVVRRDRADDMLTISVPRIARVTSLVGIRRAMRLNHEIMFGKLCMEDDQVGVSFAANYWCQGQRDADQCKEMLLRLVREAVETTCKLALAEPPDKLGTSRHDTAVRCPDVQLHPNGKGRERTASPSRPMYYETAPVPESREWGIGTIL